MSNKLRGKNDIVNNIIAAEKAKHSNPNWNYFFSIYIRFLSRAVYNLYKWENLPDTMDGRFLEMCLMQDGLAGLYYNDMLGYINTRATFGEIGIYGKAIRSTFYAQNGKFHDNVYVGQDSDNAVLVYNNATATGHVMDAYRYAMRLTDITIAHMVNIDAQKTPVTLVGDSTQLEQLAKAYEMYAGGAPVIPKRITQSQKNLPDLYQNQITVLNTNAPFVAADLRSEWQAVLHEFYLLVGINFAGNEKKYQMTVSETNANNQEVLTSAYAGLSTRTAAANQFNAIHGTDIQVKLTIDPIQLIALTDFHTDADTANLEMYELKGVDNIA